MKHDLTRRDALKGVAGAGLAGLAGCSGESEPSGNETNTSGDSETDAEVRAAFVYQTELGAVGWARAHEQGRLAIEEEFDWLETASSDAVPGGDARPVFEQYAQDGYDVIYGCTTEYMDPMATVAEQYPDTTFEHCNGTTTLGNMGRYMGRSYEAWYLCGATAGHLTESNTLGMVVSIPISELVRQVNAFALGARSVNPEATVQVRWLNAWYDPPGSTQATNALVSEGADAIGSTMASPAAVRTAAENDAWSFAANTSMAEQGGEYYATSQLYDWEAFYGESVQSVRDGSWTSDFFWGGLDSGVVTIDDFGPNVPEDVAEDVTSTQEAVASGEVDIWAGTEFEGWSDAELFGEVSSYVENVAGEVPG